MKYKINEIIGDIMIEERKAKWNKVKDALNDQIIGMSEIKNMDDIDWAIATTINSNIRTTIDNIEYYTEK